MAHGTALVGHSETVHPADVSRQPAEVTERADNLAHCPLMQPSYEKKLIKDPVEFSDVADSEAPLDGS